MDEYRIKHELAQILASKIFRSRKQICNFLSYIVEETLQGREKYLKQYTIAIHGLSKPVDFSPEENPLVRVEAGRLRKLLKEYYQEEGRYSDLRISLPKGRYQPVFLDKDVFSEGVDSRQLAKQGAASGVGKARAYSDYPRVFVGFRCYSPSPENLELYYLIARDFPSIIKKLPFVRVISASPNNPSTLASHDYLQHLWENYQADFLLRMDMEVLAGKLSLKCLLTHSVTEEVVWAYNFDMSNIQQGGDLKAVYKKVFNDLFLLSNGAVYQYWGRYLQEHHVSDNQQALLHLHGAFSRFNRQDLQAALQFCHKRLDQHPHDSGVVMMYLHLCLHDLLAGYGLVPDLQAKYTEMARSVCHLFPESSDAQLFFASACFLQGDSILCREKVEQALYLNEYCSFNYFWAGILYYALNDTKAADACIQQALSISQRYPDWYHVGGFLGAYAAGDYEKALAEAKRIHVSWGTLLRAIAYDRLHQGQALQLELRMLKATDIALLQESTDLPLFFAALKYNPWLSKLVEDAKALYAQRPVV